MATPNPLELCPPSFRKGVELLDAGDVAGLRAHLEAHPEVSTMMVTWEPGYFENPSLLAFCAENPIRNASLPATIVDAARIVLETHQPQETIDFTLGLVCSGRVARECGVQVPLIDLLCNYGADPNGALQAAVAHGEFAAAGALLRLGATLNLPIAAAMGRLEETQALLPGASAEARHKALAFSAQHGQVETLRLLLDAGEDPNRYNPPHCHAHSTPLHQAVCYGHEAAVRLLIERGANVQMEDTIYHGTALDWAEHCGQPRIHAFLRQRYS